jgi:hypothetical protein
MIRLLQLLQLVAKRRATNRLLITLIKLTVVSSFHRFLEEGPANFNLAAGCKLKLPASTPEKR